MELLKIRSNSANFAINELNKKIRDLSLKSYKIKNPLCHGCIIIQNEAKNNTCVCVSAMCFYPPYCLFMGTCYSLINILTCCTCIYYENKIRKQNAAEFTLDTEEISAIDKLKSNLRNIKDSENVDNATIFLLEEAMKNNTIVKLNSFLKDLLDNIKIDKKALEITERT